MRIIVINLDQDAERRRRVESQMADLGLHGERLSAVRGDRLTPSHEAQIDRDAQARRGLQFSPGEIGCWLSHRMAQRMVAEGQDDMALILEDDVRIHESLREVLDALERGAAGEFDLIRLHRLRRRRQYFPIRNIGAGRTIGFVRPTDSGAQAYVITREAARVLIARASRMVHLADQTLYQNWIHGLVVYSIDPPLVFHDDRGRSSIRACPGSRARSTNLSHFVRRKWHQLEWKCMRQVNFYRMLRAGRQQARTS